MSTTIVDIDSVVTVDSVTDPSYLVEDEKVYHAISYGGTEGPTGTAVPSFIYPNSNRKVILGRSISIRVKFSNPNGVFSWAIFSNGSSLVSGTCDSESEISITWTPSSLGEFSLTLQAGSVTITGPTIEVINESTPSPSGTIDISCIDPGMELELDMHLDWDQPIGQAPRAFPYAVASEDCMLIRCSFWVDSSEAQRIDSIAPPHGSGISEFVIPFLEDGIAIPGLTGTASGDKCVISGLIVSDDGESGFQTTGRKIQGMDCIGYELTTVVPIDTAQTATEWPDLVLRRIGEYSWKDRTRVVPSVASGIIGSLGRRHGRTDLVKLSCPGITASQAAQIIMWARTYRGGDVSMPSYPFGPTMVAAGETVTVRVKELKLKHVVGRFFDAELEVWRVNE